MPFVGGRGRVVTRYVIANSIANENPAFCRYFTLRAGRRENTPSEFRAISGISNRVEGVGKAR